MGLLDNLANQVLGGKSTQGNLINAIMGIIGNQQQGGLNGLIKQLTSNGLGDIVNSWVGTGKNLPITPAQIQQGLGSKTISQIASQAGLTPEAVTTQLAQLLPQIVDKLTPSGKVSQTDIASQGVNLLKSLLK
jgi:uncharacterized protein YidB (DUF937 family)